MSAARYSAKLRESLPLFDRSVSWLCWAYNEEGLIEGFLRRADKTLRRTVRDYEIVVVDDGSTDRTNAIVAALARELPRIRLVRNEANLNVGLSSRRAIRFKLSVGNCSNLSKICVTVSKKSSISCSRS